MPARNRWCWFGINVEIYEEERQVMNQAYQVTLFTLAILPFLFQDQQPTNVCHLEIKYDRYTDTTTVQCDDLVKWGQAPAGLTVQANTSFRGKEPNETAKFWFSFSSNRGVATRHTRPLFQEATTLYLLTDSTRLEIPVKDYRSTFFELIRSFEESARAEISREDLRKLLDAKRLGGKWGDVEIKFSDSSLASLKDFISRQVFAVRN